MNEKLQPKASLHNLLRLRRALGLSQRAASRAVGLGRNAIGRYESAGDGGIPVPVVMALCWIAHTEGMDPLALGLELVPSE